MGGEADMERFLSYLAICIRAPGKVHALGWITGRAKTGKSTLMKLVGKVLKGWVASEDLKNVLDADNANRGFLPLHLLGKSLIYDDDWKGGLSTRMISRLNVLATNGEMSFRSMGKDPILCSPNMGALVISNQDLIMGAADIEGLPRRMQKWEFKDKTFTDQDYLMAQSLVEEEKGHLLWYLLHKDLEDCAQELQAFTRAQQQIMERDFALNHSADWIDALGVWVDENLRSLPHGNHKGASSWNSAQLNVAGSQQAIGRMAKDTSGSDGGPYFNYLPDLFGVKVDNDGVEIVASAAR
jgi:phage/plasmid-associated DNA primase